MAVMHATFEEQRSKSDLVLAWAMDRYSGNAEAPGRAKLENQKHTAGDIAAAVALSGNPVGF